MAFLYLTQQGAIVRMSGDHLIVKKDDRTVFETPCADVEHLMVFGNIQVTTPALQKMAQRNITVAFFTGHGRLLFQLMPPLPKNVLLRREQYFCSNDLYYCLAVSQDLVAAKLQSQIDLIREHRKNHPDLAADEELELIGRMQRKARAADGLESLRGYEGTATAAYYKVFGRMLQPPWQFAGRTRRPPKDPVNAVLSFAYVIVGNEIAALLEGLGCDPYQGLYHEIDYGRQSLALDLLEEFRHTLVDRMALHLFNQNVFTPEDFEKAAREGVYLSRPGQQKFFHGYERYLGGWEEQEGAANVGNFRAQLKNQAHKMRAAIQNREKYEPLQMRSQENPGISPETIVI